MKHSSEVFMENFLLSILYVWRNTAKKYALLLLLIQFPSLLALVILNNLTQFLIILNEAHKVYICALPMTKYRSALMYAEVGWPSLYD